MTQTLPPHRNLDEFVPGVPFTPTLTPEQAVTLEAYLRTQDGGASARELAEALGLTLAAAGPLLRQFCESGRGHLSHAPSGRRRYHLTEVLTSPEDLGEEVLHKIVEFLVGRREMAGTIAKTFHLPYSTAVAACQYLGQQGRINITPVGASFVYFNERLTVRHMSADPNSLRVKAAGVTAQLEEQLRQELTPERRRIKGETARVAAKYGLSVKQVRRALARLPLDGT